MVNLPIRLSAEAQEISNEIVKLLSNLDYMGDSRGIRLTEAVSLQQYMSDLQDQLLFSGVEKQTVLANLPSTADEAVTASQLLDIMCGMVSLEDIRQVCNDYAEAIEKKKQATRYWLPVAVLV